MRTSNELIASSFPSHISSTSSVIWTEATFRASLQVTVSSGTMNGTFTIQASNDKAQGLPPNQFIPTNWSSIGTTSVLCSVSTPGTGAFLLPQTELGYEYIRAQYSTASGTTALGLYSVRLKTFAL